MGRFFGEGAVKALKENLGQYTTAGQFVTELTGMDAAEEAFNLTNNPERQVERERVYGTLRSVSSGDVVEVDGVKWACLGLGWEKL